LLGEFANSGRLCHNPRARRPADKGCRGGGEVLKSMIPESGYWVSGKSARPQIKHAKCNAIVTIAIAGFAGGETRRAKCPR
jgi:hypothetical protein